MVVGRVYGEGDEKVQEKDATRHQTGYSHSFTLKRTESTLVRRSYMRTTSNIAKLIASIKMGLASHRALHLVVIEDFRAFMMRVLHSIGC